MLAPWKKSYYIPRQYIKKQRHYFANKAPSSQGYGFSSGHVWMWEKAMATHSSTLAWQIPWMEEPGRLQSMGLLGVYHDWVTSLSLFTFMHWRRKWQPTPVFLPGESQGQSGGLPSMGLDRVRHDWSDLAAAAAACMDVRVELWRKLSAEELMLLNCCVREDSWESLRLQGDPTSPF